MVHPSYSGAYDRAGNICRSPSAEAVFKAIVEREGLSDRFLIDSCGTGGGNPDWYHTEDPRKGWSYHEGDAAGTPRALLFFFGILISAH